MWGTIARMTLRADVPEAYLLAQFKAFDQSRRTGMVSVSFYRSVEHPREIWMIAMFESEAAYRTNAATRAQHAEYLTMRACFDRDPEWHDVGKLVTYEESGSE